MRDYKIIHAKACHIDEIESIERQCFSMPWTKENLSAYLSDGMHTLLAAVSCTGSVLGYVGLMYVLDEGYIANVAVAPEHRRFGIGDALISELTDFAADNKLSFLTLEVRESNRAAIALYEKNGFIKVGLRKAYYDKPKENAVLMTKFIDQRD